MTCFAGFVMNEDENQKGREDETVNLDSITVKNDMELEYGSGTGVVMEDGVTMVYSYQWRFPVSLNEVSAVKVGEIVIPLSK